MSSVAQLTNKIKQLPQDRISQIVVVVLLIYIASILADLTWRVMPVPAQNEVNMPMQARTAGNSGLSSMVDVRNLNGLNIFGQYNAVKKEEVIEPVVDTSAPETQLQLKLSATVAEGNNSGKGTAIIEHSGQQGTYGLEDKIGNTPAILKSVFSDRVLIDNRGRIETLMLDGVEYDNMNVAREIEPPQSRPSGDNRKKDRFARDKNGQLLMPGQQKKAERLNQRRANIKKLDNRKNDNLKAQLSKKREEVTKNPQKLFDLIRFSPVRRGGTLVGYRLNPGADPDLFRQAGFRPNDLAVQVNGYALNDMQQAMTAMREFRTMTEANIVIERDGVETEILFSLDGAADPSNSGSKRGNALPPKLQRQ